MMRDKAFRFFAAGVVTAIAIVAVNAPAHAGPGDDERALGAIVGSVIGGMIGSTIGDGRGRDVAIGVGSLLGGIAGYHAVDPAPYRPHRHGHRHLRHRRHVRPNYLLPRPYVYVHPRQPRRERHVHHHYYETQAQPRTVVTYQLPAPVMPVREVNVVTLPPRGRSNRVFDTVLTECKVLEAGIAPVYACRTAGGDWRLLK